MLEKIPEILTLKQCQEILSVGKNTMLSLIHNGDIEAFMINHRWRVTRNALINFIHRNRY